MPENRAETIDVPPFPTLTWDGYFWTSLIALKSWAGFQSRLGSQGAVSAATGSDGSARLMAVPPEDAPRPPLPEQTAAYQHLLDQEEAIRNSILQAVFAAYPGLQKTYGYADEDAEELMPDLGQPSDLSALIGLANVHILNVASQGVA